MWERTTDGDSSSDVFSLMIFGDDSTFDLLNGCGNSSSGISPSFKIKIIYDPCSFILVYLCTFYAVECILNNN